MPKKKKVTLDDINGMVSVGGDAVESKRRVQEGSKADKDEEK